MQLSTLNVPIQINGGDITAPQLYTRELYITNSYQLYVGEINSDNETKVKAQPIKVGIAENANQIKNNKNFWLNANQANFQIGYLYFNDSTKTFLPTTYTTSTTPPNSGIKGYITFSDINLTKIPKITITSDMYGSAAPTTKGEEGQLYFRYA